MLILILMFVMFFSSATIVSMDLDYDNSAQASDGESVVVLIGKKTKVWNRMTGTLYFTGDRLPATVRLHPGTDSMHAVCSEYSVRDPQLFPAYDWEDENARVVIDNHDRAKVYVFSNGTFINQIENGEPIEHIEFGSINLNTDNQSE